MYSGEIYSLFLYSAHLDVRKLTSTFAVRVVAAMSRPNLPREALPFCQLWLDGRSEALAVRVENVTHLEPGNRDEGNDTNVVPTPVLFSCPVPELAFSEPVVAVSIADKPCERPTNALHVFNGDRSMLGYEEDDIAEAMAGRVAYCLKGLAYPFKDLSWTLTEWLEVTRRLGVDKVAIYYLQLQPKTLEALSYYVE